MGTIYYKLYNPSGLFNQVISLEIAVGLSSALNKNLLIYNITNPPNPEYGYNKVSIYSANHKYNDRKGLIDDNVFPNISDFLDWQNKDECILIHEDIDSFINQDVLVTNLMKHYYSGSKDVSLDEQLFSEDRKALPTGNNMHLQKTLGYYSRFFYNRDDKIDNALSSVKFKEEYYEIASKIAKSLGIFNGIHLRLTDHTHYSKITASHFEDGLDRLKGKKIVVCTDEPNHPMVKNSSADFILLDQYILDNFYEDFKQLKIRDEISFGILNNLVMHYSQDFIGTPGSTFSGYIQRNINQNKDYEWKLFNTKPEVQNGPYSWTEYPEDTITKQWWREWHESKLNC